MKNCDSSPPADGVRASYVALFLCATTVFLYLRTFLLPGTPLAAHDDELIFFEHGNRILHGQVPFRDFFIFVMPGTDLLYAGTFRLFGVHAWVAQATAIVLGLALTGVIVWISSRILRGPIVFLPALLFLALDYDSALDATHHWYNTLLVMAAAGVLLGGRSARRVLAAGVLCGIATIFTQTQGGLSLIAIAVYLVWAARDEGEQSRLTVQLGALILPFVVIVGGVLGYYAHKAGFHSLLYALWDYPFKFAAAEHSFPFRSYLYKIPPHRTPGDLARMAPFVFIHLLIPFAYLFCLVRLFREKTRMDRRLWERILLINLVGLALFAAVAAGPSYHRLCMIAPPAIVLCVWYFSGETRVDRTVRGLCWSISIVLFLFLPVRLQLLPRTYLDLPTGRTAFLSLPEYEETRWLAGQTHAGESFFNLTQVSFVLALQNPTPVDFVTPTEITPPEQVDAVVRSLEVHQTPFVFLPQFYAPREIIDSLQPFREYVYNNYHLAKAFPSGQFWERN